jgi:lipopolysaccharide transport system permease protein
MFRRPSASSNPSVETLEWVLAPDLRAGALQRLEEVWRYRRILWFFAVKAVQGLYAKTRLGPVWLVLRPLAPLIAGSLVFGGIMKIPSDGYPYFLFLLVGTTIWNFFDSPLIFATRGLESNRQLLTKLYLPRLILPAGQMAAGLAEPVVCVGVLIVSVFYYRYADGVWYVSLTPRLFIAIPLALMTMLLAFSISLWTSVWQARARDMRFVLMYSLSFWYLLTPIVYPVSHLPPAAQWAAYINPMAGPVMGFKWAVLGIGAFPAVALAVSAAVTILLLGFGMWYFAAVEGQTIDRL